MPAIHNPDARWDGYKIGGACSGVLTGYDPTQDPENWEVCRFCQGMGQRPETVAVSPELGCNGCRGRGQALKYPAEWKPYEGDTLPVPVVLRNDPDFIPSAVVTPSGEWIEEGLDY